MKSEKVTIGDATLYRGDMLEVVPRLRRQIDAVVTDPPYHLQNIAGRAARTFNAKEDGLQKNGAMARLAGGFMGQQWDGGDIAFRPETWAAIAEPLRPGGFLLAFGGTRTWHRMACAIEDAGFVIQDTIAWVYGTGFPKNRTLLKPAFEPIVLAYKPGGKRTMQVDECRIAGEPTHGSGASMGGMFGMNDIRVGVPNVINTQGRWPANVCHDGSDEVVACFPETHSAGAARGGGQADQNGTGGMFGAGNHIGNGMRFGDKGGSAARFFYAAKANKHDRAGSRHPTVKPQALMRWLVPLITPPGGTVLDPFGGSGSTAQAALATGRRCVLIEREENWFQDACARIEAAHAERKAAA